jgi:antitoxin (DNA-binding transcriptional repressor) of toxin-antitoxin stability system
MTPAEEQEFIRLWTQGLETAAIAQALGIPVGTVSSRAHVLQLRGKIQARPRGGPHARCVAQARQGETGASTDTSGISKRVSSDTPTLQYLPPNQGELLPVMHEILQELRTLTHGLVARVSAGVSARTPLPVERGKSVRWNLHLSEGLRERIKAQAKARGLQDSQMVEDLLWLALSIVEGNADGPD